MLESERDMVKVLLSFGCQLLAEKQPELTLAMH
jgi:hypothetical protein